MKMNYRNVAAVLGALSIALLAQPNCAAQCGSGALIKPHVSWHGVPNAGGLRLLPAAFQNDNGNDDRPAWKPSIVGFWHVVFTAKTSNRARIPDTAIDSALVVWHSDGTEIMNSGRPAQDGNFCMGVWEQTGPRSYKLNHFALGNKFAPGTPDGVVGEPDGPTRFLESVSVSADGKQYSGTFTLIAHQPTGEIYQTFTGVVTATRITLDTKVADIL